MSWSGGTYSKGNAGTGGWVGDASLGIGIEAGRHDTQDNDFATGINNCLAKDGQNAMTANLNFGGFLPTNVGAGTAAAPAFCAGNDPDTGMFYAAANQLGFATGGIERLRVDVSGRIGIGTTSPGFLLDAQLTSANAAAFQRFTTTGDGPFVTLIKSRGATVGTNTIVQPGDTLGTIAFGGANGTSYNDAAYIRGIVDSTPGASNDMPGRLEFCTTPDGSGLPIERMRIDSNGSTQLSGRLVFLTTTTASGTGAYASAANTLNLCTDSASRLEIGSTGGVGIGGVSDGTVRLTTYGADTGSSNFSFAARSSTTYLFGVRNDGRVGIGTSTPGYQLALSTDSAAKPTTNTWTIASDERIKTNVQPYAKGLAEICQVNPITYDYNGKGGIPAGPGGVSILAQELQPVFPECVGSYKGKLDEGDEEDTDILNYNGHAITFALINAVKELNAKVEALEAKVENLEAVTAGL